MARHSVRRLAVLLLTLAVAGCGGDETTGPPPGQVPDFSLVDVNPTSPRHDSSVSPRDYLGSVSAWYFGHAT